MAAEHGRRLGEMECETSQLRVALAQYDEAALASAEARDRGEETRVASSGRCSWLPRRLLLLVAWSAVQQAVPIAWSHLEETFLVRLEQSDPTQIGPGAGQSIPAQEDIPAVAKDFTSRLPDDTFTVAAASPGADGAEETSEGPSTEIEGEDDGMEATLAAKVAAVEVGAKPMNHSESATGEGTADPFGETSESSADSPENIGGLKQLASKMKRSTTVSVLLGSTVGIVATLLKFAT
mmetsp:Transcript_64432/g.163302  ORF Transcript_64432/g.163302 Transcript_64432/m.163302 type:complete len:237 (+) Transcript_64432:138-848(+)